MPSKVFTMSISPSNQPTEAPLTAVQSCSQPHPLRPLEAAEIDLAVSLLQQAFPDADLRFKVMDLQEPSKRELVPFLEAERTGAPLPAKPPRILYALFNRLDTGAFLKGLVSITDRQVVRTAELRDVQVSIIYVLGCEL